MDGASNRLIGPTYDAAGNVIADGKTRTYQFDSLNAMTAVKGSAGRRRMIYDASDERIGTIIDSTLSRWTIRDFEGQVLREYKGDWNGLVMYWTWEQDHIRGEGQLLGGETQEWGYTAAYRYGGKRDYHLDHLGSVRLVTNDAGRSLAENDYYPFGATQTRTFQEQANPGDPHTDGMRFAGHWRDFLGYLNVESSEYVDYMHARYYDPGKGRFLSVDPTWESADLKKPQSWNRYAYVMNNPVNMTDPDGKCPTCIDPKELGKAAWATGAEFFVDYVLWDGSGLDPEAKPDLSRPAVAGAIITTQTGDEILTRRTNKESAKRLADKAADAEKKLGIHGVSASAATPQPGETVAAQAARSEVEKTFKVHNTPTRSDPLHRTVELPKPVTNKVARLFNWLFKSAL